MTADLEDQPLELEERRRTIETILANITAGVVSVDRDGRVTTVNPAAARCSASSDAGASAAPFARGVRRLRPRRDRASCWPSSSRARARACGTSCRRTRQVKLRAGGAQLTLVLTAPCCATTPAPPLGALLFFEDVTELLKVQRMEAWREVARRIAHEIKNPLTPIQLSAQRLRKRYAEQLKEDGTLLRGVHAHDHRARSRS